MKKYYFTFDPRQTGLRKIFGDLEADIMEVLWNSGRLTVRDVFEKLKLKRRIAYTTVMTVMTRLAQKGVLKKIKDGNAFIYEPILTREIFTQTTSQTILKGLLSDFSLPLLSQFVDSLEKEDPQKIHELSKLIDAKLKKQKK
ncbi:BlaI/MecI/CopY family transcriptional regulator [bacterium]|nr:BlaI/MecI/CopY family transcriptional regulator [bacterium]